MSSTQRVTTPCIAPRRSTSAMFRILISSMTMVTLAWMSIDGLGLRYGNLFDSGHLHPPFLNRCDGPVLEPMIKTSGGPGCVPHGRSMHLLSLPLLPHLPQKQTKGGFSPPKKPRKTQCYKKFILLTFIMTTLSGPFAGLDMLPHGCYANCWCRRRGWTRGECEGKRGHLFFLGSLGKRSPISIPEPEKPHTPPS